MNQMTNDEKNNYLSLPSPGLWPRENPRPTDSYAESKVYNSLKDRLPEGWYGNFTGAERTEYYQYRIGNQERSNISKFL